MGMERSCTGGLEEHPVEGVERRRGCEHSNSTSTLHFTLPFPSLPFPGWPQGQSEQSE